MTAKVLTLPVAQKPQWSKPPGMTQTPPLVLGYCPACGRPVHELAGSPTEVLPNPARRRHPNLSVTPHLWAAYPCGCWLLPEEADELGRN